MGTITNYDGSITVTPQAVVKPKTIDELQEILKNTSKYPGPVRAMGNFHSLTPCAASGGTIVDMRGLNKIVKIDRQALTFTAQAGLQMIEANEALQKEHLQLMLNIEIGNMTLGSAACCHSKDSLDGVEFGQVNSYLVAVKWVTPAGELAEASAARNAELLPKIRASYGLAGIIYEVTLRIKPLEFVRFNYKVHELASLTQDDVTQAIATNDSIVCWTIGRTTVIQTRNRTDHLEHEWLAETRRFGWNFLAAFLGRGIREHAPAKVLEPLEDLGLGIELGFYRVLDKAGGFTLRDCDKMIDYTKTPHLARYAFTFWAFPRADFVTNLKDYVDFAESYYRQHGFRCNMPLGSYFIRQDSHSLLSYSHAGDVISLDPIHAPGERDKDAWADFLRAFNEWATRRGGLPLLNQSPFVKRGHVVAAYGERWKTLCDWLRTVDPQKRMVNPFFEELMV
jgi:FAD/FMN-containing dehydrogenase